MNRRPTLEGELVVVRPLRAEDFDELYAVAADPLLWEQHPEKERWREEAFRAYFEGHLASGGGLAVVDRANGKLIGATRYDNYDPVASEVEIGWTFLARPYWGGVYNADLKRVMLDHAFQSVETVVFLVGADNIRSRRAVEKLGAAECGTRRGMVLYAVRDERREIETQRLRLRPFRADDLPAFVAYRSDPDVARYQSWNAPYSMDEAESFLRSQAGLRFGAPGEWLQLAILDRATGTLYGDCAVRVATDQPETAEIGVTLAKAHQRKGIATEALTAVVSELFEQLGLHRVFAEADERNVPVHVLLERLGFRCEGRLVEADWFKGAWSTLRVYAVLDREWRATTTAFLTANDV